MFQLHVPSQLLERAVAARANAMFHALFQMAHARVRFLPLNPMMIAFGADVLEIGRYGRVDLFGLLQRFAKPLGFSLVRIPLPVAIRTIELLVIIAALRLELFRDSKNDSASCAVDSGELDRRLVEEI